MTTTATYAMPVTTRFRLGRLAEEFDCSQGRLVEFLIEDFYHRTRLDTDTGEIYAILHGPDSGS